MPQRLKTQFTYNVQKIMSATGTGAFIIFRGNSLFDPDQTSVGQRANSLTEMSAFYSKYGVIGSSITIDIANSDVPIRILVYPTADSGATGLTYGTALTVPKVRHTIVGSVNGSGLGRLHNYSSTFDMLNQDPATDDGVQSLVTTNPGDQWYWVILGRAMDDASVWTVTLNINVVYYTVLSERKLISYV